MSLRESSRSAPLLVVLVTGVLSLSACVFPAEPAPGSPASPQQLSNEGFPPPGPAPQPGVVTPSPVGPGAPSEAPRPPSGPQTPTPQTSASEPTPTNAPAPPPGS